MPTVQEFEIAYVRLTHEPTSKVPSGLPYEQLLAAWEQAGRPSDIDKFLIHGKAENAIVQTEPSS